MKLLIAAFFAVALPAFAAERPAYREAAARLDGLIPDDATGFTRQGRPCKIELTQTMNGTDPKLIDVTTVKAIRYNRAGTQADQTLEATFRFDGQEDLSIRSQANFLEIGARKKAPKVRVLITNTIVSVQLVANRETISCRLR